MSTSTTTLQQAEIPGEPSSAVLREFSLETVSQMRDELLHAAPSEGSPCVVGISVGLADSGPHIRSLALATPGYVFDLSLPRPPSPAQKRILRTLFSKIPCLAGFEMPYIIVLVAHTIDGDISGHDISTVKFGTKPSYMRMPGALIKSKDCSGLASMGRIDERWESDTKTSEPNHRVRAWFTAIAANMIQQPSEGIQQPLEGTQLLSTESLSRAMLRCLVDFSTRSIRLESMKPHIQENDFIKVQGTQKGLRIENARFKTRVRLNKHTRVELQLENNKIVEAKVKRTCGRSTFVVTKQAFTGKVIRIRVIGREDPTPAEMARFQFLRDSLRVSNSHRRAVPFFVEAIWLPKNLKGKKGNRNASTKATICKPSHLLESLNTSQRKAATAMLSVSRNDSLVIVHGPPGTGKTTTIAAAAATWVDNGVPCWMVAQSNVGVKNIAETLFRRGVKFKLLVSKDFIFEWHEELYREMNDVVIRSDQLKHDASGIRQMFTNNGITLVLSTLSMLSNPTLNDCGLFKLIPVRSLIVDEASQIDVFEFMHLFYKFSKVLEKVCFFGDPRQLPPYGAQEAKLQTIFEVKHLSETSYLLDTQYRLPVPLGGFISKAVYEGKLQSRHDIVDHSCVAFIDVEKGTEAKRGKSYQNTEEVHMAVRVAKRYHQRRLKFCIITFYDSQRSAIAKALEVEKVPSGCVYNVDSFQGNETDYVILSSVRTQEPGFLESLARMNVALTRCRRGLIVVTNKSFLQRSGKSTLLGKLCHSWSLKREAWIDWRTMLGTEVDLPGIQLVRA